MSIWDISLRQLLLFQSLYVCKTQTDILSLIQEQPNPSVFYMPFLELDKTNMLNIMSYDSRSIQTLLSEEFEEYFTPDWPVFFTNRVKHKSGTDYYRNALDISLKNNQIGAVNKILWYIINY